MANKSSFFHAAFGTVALSMAIGWNRHKPSLPIKTPSLVDAAVPWFLSIVGGWWLLKSLGSVPIGVTRKLGIPLNDNDNDNSNNKSFKRRLGFLERWYVAHSRTGMHTGFLIALDLEATTKTNKSGGVPSLKGIRQCLQRVSQRFPWLRVKVGRDGVYGVDSRKSLSNQTAQGDKSKPIWGDDLYVQVCDQPPSKAGDFFDLRQVAVPQESEFPKVFERILEEESTKEWHDEDSTTPMWRATVVTCSDQPDRFSLVLAFHHLIVDGMGSTAIAQAILEELNGSSSPDKGTDNSTQNNQLAPPMEDAMDTVPLLSHLLIPVLLDRFPSLNPYFKPPHWKGLAEHDTSGKMERKSVMVCCPISLDGELLASVCREMEVTVNSLCVATLCKAIAKTIGNQTEHNSTAMQTDNDKDCSTTTVRFKLQVAKNERNNCHPIQPSDLGVYLSGPQVYVSAKTTTAKARVNDEYQAIASSFQKRLRGSLRGAAMDMGLCAFIPGDWIPFAAKFAKNKPNGINDSIEFSNLGKVAFDSDDNAAWKAKDFWFAQGRRETGAAMIATIARNGVAGEEIRAVLSAFPQAVPRATLAKIAETWKADMERLVGKEDLI